MMELNSPSWKEFRVRHTFTGELSHALVMQGCLSYPFFDPVLTDRAFLAKPSTMLGAFLLGGVVAALFIFFFGFVGIYGNAVATLRPEW